MKTTSQKNSSGSELKSRSALSSSSTQTQPVGAFAPAAVEKKDTRLPIDSAARKQNRSLPTPKVLHLLSQSLPDVYRDAEVVGKWVWVSFQAQPAAEIRQQLAQLGFHWNRERQAWQHPCGQFSLRGSTDPHEKYASYHPADMKAA